MAIHHRRPRPTCNNGSSDSADSILPTFSRRTKTRKPSLFRTRGHHRCPPLVRQNRIFLIIGLVVVALMILLVVWHCVLDEYAWVHRRCLKPWLPMVFFQSPNDNVVVNVECVEAATHKRAVKDPRSRVPHGTRVTMLQAPRATFILTEDPLKQIVLLARNLIPRIVSRTLDLSTRFPILATVQ